MMANLSGSLVKRIGVLALISLLAACAHGGGGKGGFPGKSPTPNPHAKIGSPYKVAGRTYVPQEDPFYVEEGIASWYGPNFHGKLTANGELFDQNRLTAAHKTLPLPSLVRVTNLENGRTAVLRLNDRGPFANNRVIDLSKAAAEELRMRDQGLARVRVEYLAPAGLDHAITRVGERENYAALEAPVRSAQRVRASPDPVVVAQAAVSVPVPVPSAKPASNRPELVPAVPGATAHLIDDQPDPIAIVYSGAVMDHAVPLNRSIQPTAHLQTFYVQIGTFRAVENVNAAKARLPEAVPVHVSTVDSDYGPLHQVRLGPYSHEFAAAEAERFARREGFSDAHIVQEAEAH